MSHNTEKTALKTAVMGDSSQPLLQAGTVLLSARVGENKPPPPSSPEPNRTKRKKEIQSVEPCIPQWAFRRPICFVFLLFFLKPWIPSLSIFILQLLLPIWRGRKLRIFQGGFHVPGLTSSSFYIKTVSWQIVSSVVIAEKTAWSWRKADRKNSS